ncbi:MAG: HsdR family type I site-specific deoxyribonuclease [Bacteroidales bacterium]|nr:HsdR family type I site-specific deoxyribonuclease [Bacteroidales bacterium]
MAFDDELKFEKALVDTLKTLGWGKYDVLNYPTAEDLKKNWVDILYNNNRSEDKLGNYRLTDSEVEQILDQVQSRSPYDVNKFVNGNTVTIVRDNTEDTRNNGCAVSLNIYDRNEIAGGHSVYQIARQPIFDVPNPVLPSRRGDVMLLINGMPLFHIELKKSNIPISQACEQIKKYYHYGVYTGIFSFVQIFVAMNPEEAVYFTNPGSESLFNEKFYFHWADSDNIQINDWKRFAEDFLYIPMAHKLIGFYTVPDRSDESLKVLRSYQFYAVDAIEKKVMNNDWNSGNQRGGFIWHTTGSGKTLTSFKTADLISKSQYADKVVFLVDRIELDVQSLKKYRYFADSENDVQDTDDTSDLIEKMQSTYAKDTLIVASIQKMSRVCDDGTEFMRSQIDHILRHHKKIVFIVDECHRDTFGKMMGKVKDTFPNALFFGFTGTPIKEENKKKGCKSTDVFGDELHRYTICDGIRDGNVLAFAPYKVLTFKDRDIKQKVILHMVKASNTEEVRGDPEKQCLFDKLMNEMEMTGHIDEDTGKYIKGAEDYLKSVQYRGDEHESAVVSHIVENYELLSSDKKFHSIFATSSIKEAIDYYRRFKEADPDLKTTVLIDKSEDNNGHDIDRIDGLAEIITDYNERYGTRYTVPSYRDMKKDVSDRLAHEEAHKGIENRPDEELDMLIVVNQMLTGFDSKWINTLYLDKVLQKEAIIQAFSRTNRIYGHEKPHGTIFYFRKPHTMEKNIDEAVTMYSGEDSAMVYVDELEKNLKRFNDIFKDIEELFESAGIECFSHLPDEVAQRAKFALLFNSLYSVLETIKVQGFTWNRSVYGDTTVRPDEDTYKLLLVRYKDLPPREGTSAEAVPYDLRSYITEIETKKINAEYFQNRFVIWHRQYEILEGYNQNPQDPDSMSEEDKRLLREAREKEETAFKEFVKVFSSLSEEDQEIVDTIISDIKRYILRPDGNHSIYDYISEYKCRKSNDRIHKFAETFGVDEEELRSIIDLHLPKERINEFGRLNRLRDCDLSKTIEYFTQKNGEDVPGYLAKARYLSLLDDFVTKGGFDI